MIIPEENNPETDKNNIYKIDGEEVVAESLKQAKLKIKMKGESFINPEP